MNHIGIQIGWPTHSEPSGQRLPEQGQNQIGSSMPDRGAIWQSQIWQIAFFNLATQKAIWQSGNLEKQSGQITVAWPVFGTLQQFWVVAQASSI